MKPLDDGKKKNDGVPAAAKTDVIGGAEGLNLIQPDEHIPVGAKMY